MSGLIGLEQVGGFRDIIQLFFAGLMNIARSISNWVWSALGGSGQEASAWLADNWLRLLIALLVLGVALDWGIWMVRWQPYKLWLSRRRGRARDVSTTKTLAPLANEDAAAETVRYDETASTIDQPVAEDAPEIYPERYDDTYMNIVEPSGSYNDELDIVMPLVTLAEDEDVSALAALPLDFPIDALPDDNTADTEPAAQKSWIPWRKPHSILRTVTGKPARRRGLRRLAGDDDEAIAGLPPMMSHDEGYMSPTLPPALTSLDVDSADIINPAIDNGDMIMIYESSDDYSNRYNYQPDIIIKPNQPYEPNNIIDAGAEL